VPLMRATIGPLQVEEGHRLISPAAALLGRTTGQSYLRGETILVPVTFRPTSLTGSSGVPIRSDGCSSRTGSLSHPSPLEDQYQVLRCYGLGRASSMTRGMAVQRI
jgi:hypothetical protein